MANGLWDYYKRHMMDHPPESMHTAISDPKYLAAQDTLNRIYSRMTNTPTNIFELRIGDYMINCDTSCVFDKSVKLAKFPNGECMDIDPDRVYQLLKIYRDARDSL